MKTPLIDDWDGVSWRGVCVQWPDSELWRGLLLGQLSAWARGRAWDERTGRVVDGQSVGRAIWEANQDMPPCVTSEGSVSVFGDTRGVLRYEVVGNGGSAVAGLWTVLQYNELVNDADGNITFVPTPYNIFSLLPGTWRIIARTDFMGVKNAQTRLVHSDSNDIVYDINGKPIISMPNWYDGSADVGWASSQNQIDVVLYLSDFTTFQLQYKAQIARAGEGLGYQGVDVATPTTHREIQFWRIADASQGPVGGQGIPGPTGPQGIIGPMGARGMPGEMGICDCGAIGQVYVPEGQPEDESRCGAALALRDRLKAEGEDLLAKWQFGQSITEFAAELLEAIPLIGDQASLIFDIYDGMLQALHDAILAEATAGFWDDVRCIFWCILGENGAIDEGTMLAIETELRAIENAPTARDFYANMFVGLPLVYWQQWVQIGALAPSGECQLDCDCGEVGVELIHDETCGEPCTIEEIGHSVFSITPNEVTGPCFMACLEALGGGCFRITEVVPNWSPTGCNSNQAGRYLGCGSETWTYFNNSIDVVNICVRKVRFWKNDQVAFALAVEGCSN